MQACGNCGRQKTAGKAYCTWCGASFDGHGGEPAGGGSSLPAAVWRAPESARPADPATPTPAVPPEASSSQAEHAVPPGPVWSPDPVRSPAIPGAQGRARKPYLAAAFGAIGALALAGLGVGAWFLIGHTATSASGARDQAGRTTAASARSATASTGALAAGTSAASPGPSPSTGAAVTIPAGPVTVAAGAGASAAAPGIAAFLDKYFNAINTHNYNAYMALRDSRMSKGFSKSVFDSGYGSTVDSGATLTRISSAANGDSVAHVRFTSHQSAAASPTGTACDHWTIALYLLPDGGGYLMDSPPSHYHAKYAAC